MSGSAQGPSPRCALLLSSVLMGVAVIAPTTARANEDYWTGTHVEDGRGEGDLSDALAWIATEFDEAAVVGYEDHVAPHQHRALGLIVSRDVSLNQPIDEYGCDNSLIDGESVVRTSGEERWSHRACVESQFLGDRARGYRTLGTVRLSAAKVAPWVEAAAAESQVPAEIIHLIIRFLSGYRPHAESDLGHIGLMQLRKDILASEGLQAEDLFEPRENIRMGALYLAKLIHSYRDLIAALGAYLNGREHVLRANGLPPDRRVLWFSREVLRLYYAQHHPFPWRRAAEDMAFVFTWMD